MRIFEWDEEVVKFLRLFGLPALHSGIKATPITGALGVPSPNGQSVHISTTKLHYPRLKSLKASLGWL